MIMADRTSAALFGRIFNRLAQNPTDENKKLASEIFDLMGEYDFNEYQMYEDESLLALGLAKMGINPDYPRDGEMIIYKGDNGWD